MNIDCPATMRRHVQKVLDGEYEVPYRATRPVILDIGANVGSYAAWALKRWPGPRPLLRAATGEFCAAQEEPRVSRGAVDQLEQFRHRRPEPKNLYLGRNNCGEASFYDVGEQSTATVEVETRAPSVLPKAHTTPKGRRSTY